MNCESGTIRYCFCSSATLAASPGVAADVRPVTPTSDVSERTTRSMPLGCAPFQPGPATRMLTGFGAVFPSTCSEVMPPQVVELNHDETTGRNRRHLNDHRLAAQVEPRPRVRGVVTLPANRRILGRRQPVLMTKGVELADVVLRVSRVHLAVELARGLQQRKRLQVGVRCDGFRIGGRRHRRGLVRRLGTLRGGGGHRKRRAEGKSEGDGDKRHLQSGFRHGGLSGDRFGQTEVA